MLRVTYLVLTFSYLINGFDIEKDRKSFIGKHTFPRQTPKGKEAANEFQFIQPENIVKDSKYNAADSNYIINSVSPTVINNNDIITVTFNSLKPSSKDWIGAYSPADVDITTTVPVKYGYCDEADSYLTKGNGYLTFNMTNLRSDISFYYFTNGVSKPVLVASSSQYVTFKNINEPLRPRVVPTKDYDVFSLLWSSATSSAPTLKWGTEKGVYKNVVTADTTSVDKSSICGAPANTIGWRELGLIHSANLVGMTVLANQKIYYIFGDEKTNDFSTEKTFFVPPVPGSNPPDRGTTVILFDDLGRGSTDMTYTWNEYGRPSIYTIMAVGDEIANGKVDAVYHGGDISYACGYEAVWDFYLDMISNMAGSALYMTTVGNHESDWYDSASYFSNGDSGGECGISTSELIPLPYPATTNKPWWSYNVGLIHFIGVSTEHNITIGSEQYYWLQSDLKSVDRTKQPWIIFGGHRAMYINSNYGGSESSDIGFMDLMIANVEPLLKRYRVNLGFYGHNHVVQRQSAVYNKTVIQKSVATIDENGDIYYLHTDPQATVQTVIGTGGASFTINAVTPPPVWNERFFYEYGYARVTAVNASYLNWEWILASTGEVYDHMVITQTDPTKPWV